MPTDLIFLHGSHTSQCIATVDKHFVYHTLQLMTAGSVELFYDDRRTLMEGQWMWPCCPGPRIRFHEWPRGRPWAHRYIAMSGTRVRSWQAAGLWPEQPERIEDPYAARRLAGWMDDVIADARRPGRWSRLRAINTLERILLDRAEHRASAAPAQPAWLGRVLARLADLQSPEPDYAALAQEQGMSLSTLRRQFRRLTGLSPHDYRLEARINAAQQMLGETDLPIKAIASRLGYLDVYYFTRQFRQRTGVTPGEYRRSRQ